MAVTFESLLKNYYKTIERIVLSVDIFQE